MNKNSNIFERIEHVCEVRRIGKIPDLAKKLRYSSPEKLYRLNRLNDKGEPNNPSFEMLNDLANLFVDLNLRWLITGVGEPFPKHAYDFKVDSSIVAEPNERVSTNERLIILEAENRALLKAIREFGAGHFESLSHVGLKKIE